MMMSARGRLSTSDPMTTVKPANITVGIVVLTMLVAYAVLATLLAIRNYAVTAKRPYLTFLK